MGKCFYKPPIMVDYRIKIPVVNLFAFSISHRKHKDSRCISCISQRKIDTSKQIGDKK